MTTKILDIHTHRHAPQPDAVVCVSPENFNPIDNQLYSVGIHPWLTAEGIPDELWDALEEAAKHPQVVAIGECGIDLVKGGPLYKQMLVMKRQVELSERIGKPLIIHCVHAHDIVIGLKKDLKPTQKWLVHGFRGKPTVAAMFCKAGIALSFGDKYNDSSVKDVPEGMLFAETDESEVSIEEIITRLSVLAGRDLTPEIARDSALFLGMENSDANGNDTEGPAIQEEEIHVEEGSAVPEEESDRSEE